MRMLFLLLSALLFVQCGAPETKKQVLFNGTDLTGWDTYLGPAYDTAQQKFDTLSIPGLNNDPKQVFSVVQADGAPAIRVSGNAWGAISTKDEFQNYHLTLQFKWGTAKFAPRLDKPRDSGVIYHSTGPFGAAWRNWMAGLEFQVQEGDCGDFWSIAGATADVPAAGDTTDSYRYSPGAAPVTIGGGASAGNRCIKSIDAEKSSGEWNTIEIYVLGDTAIHVMNGVVNNVLYESRLKQGDSFVPLRKGKIQFQVEGAELYYRSVEVESITSLPEGLIKL